MVGGYDAIPYGCSMICVTTRVSTDQHFCGGSIISDLFILTAAHYVTNRSVTGRTNLFIVSRMHQREVDRVDIFLDGIDGRVILG